MAKLPLTMTQQVKAVLAQLPPKLYLQSAVRAGPTYRLLKITLDDGIISDIHLSEPDVWPVIEQRLVKNIVMETVK